MVVSDDDARGSVGQRIRENLPRVYRCPVDQPDGHDPNVQDLVRAVDAGAEKMLLLPVRIVAHMREKIGRGLDLRPFRLDAAPGDLESRQNQSCLRISLAFLLGEILGPNA